MQPDAESLLWDAHRAAVLIDGFVAGRTWEDYQHDPMLRSAVERQFEIVGEALNRLSRVDPSLAGGIGELPRVAFRNAVIHGCATIDDAILRESGDHPARPADRALGRPAQRLRTSHALPAL